MILARALEQDSDYIEAQDGATATRTADGRLTLRSPRGEMLFEYHADGSGRCVVFAPVGDLELRAEHGRIALRAAEGIDLETAGEVRIEAKALRTVVELLQQTAGVVEQRAERWIERLGSVFREIEGLSQTRARRVRTIARETMQLLGKRTVLKAEGDMKINGERIHLG